MALSNAERQKKHKEKRKALRVTAGNVTGNGVTKGSDVTENVTPEVTGVVTESIRLLQDVVVEHTLLLRAVAERLDRLEAAQAKVSVVPGTAVKAFGYSKEAQLKGRIVDNSPLGRAYREQNGS